MRNLSQIRHPASPQNWIAPRANRSTHFHRVSHILFIACLHVDFAISHLLVYYPLIFCLAVTGDFNFQDYPLQLGGVYKTSSLTISYPGSGQILDFNINTLGSFEGCIKNLKINSVVYLNSLFIFLLSKSYLKHL